MDAIVDVAETYAHPSNNGRWHQNIAPGLVPGSSVPAACFWAANSLIWACLNAAAPLRS